MTRPMPERSTCRNCGEPISWDDWSYVHDASFFADCGVTVLGGTKTTLGAIARGLGLEPVSADNVEECAVVLNPEIHATRTDGKMAEPIEWADDVRSVEA